MLSISLEEVVAARLRVCLVTNNPTRKSYVVRVEPTVVYVLSLLTQLGSSI